MPKDEPTNSDPQTPENDIISNPSSPSSSEQDEQKNPEDAGAEYEKERQVRLAENKARMEALGLHKMANSLMGSAQSSGERRGLREMKRVGRKSEKNDDDDEYMPNNDEEEDEEEGDDVGGESSGEEYGLVSGKGRKAKARSIKIKNATPRSGKKVSVQKLMDVSDVMDEDEALMRAIALSLQDSEGVPDIHHCGSSEGSAAQPSSVNVKARDKVSEENSGRKKRKTFPNRTQMTEDGVVIHFCQFDEVGKGSITFRDVLRMATTHDFTWTDKEIADMIRCFDTDNDGKLTLDDFRNIVQRCNMLKGLENS